MNSLKQFFFDAGFRGNDLETIVQTFSLKLYLKDDHFIEAGKTNRHMGFIEKGLFQYFVLVQGEERTTYITAENSFIASLVSFLNNTPSREYIRALTDARVWMITKADVKKLQADIPLFKDFYIGILEWQIGCIDKSRHDLITLNAEQRYAKLLNDEPLLLQTIPLQYLASILGVTPRHLSRIRKNIR